jgi:dihydroxyacetone kinase
VSATLRLAVLAAADAVEAAQDELGVLDSVAGDGDHGVTMAILARNVRRTLEEAPDATGADLVGRVALAAASVGGATGPLYGTGLMRIAAEMRAIGPAGPWVQISSQMERPRRRPPRETTWGPAPGSKYRISSKTS